MSSEHYDLLSQFLSAQISAADEVFSFFEALPGAVSGRGANSLERYVYVPGTRADRVLLVAHADTVWDTAYGGPEADTALTFDNGVFYGTDPERGIGADDRAGCAMLYALRRSGHSLLLLNGEEHGKKGARYLRKHNKKLFQELNCHRYMIEFDWAGTGGCLFNQVDYSDKFKRYIEEELKFCDSRKDGGCDLQILCHRICGVNVGVGYHGHHTAKEYLSLEEWENTYRAVSDFLVRKQPRFPVGKRRRLKSNIRRLHNYARAALRKAAKLLKRK